ncbi:hypothetical protein H696_01579 [Fonticula alba]|uniref:Zinc finger ZPR1-type domain-containing protein n=1 Tax=Fonticula alba TaxID=691883 RepID=A0A058ZFC1_FONAL|nr:hypothetical protein H696_01579 [Fonticula alba]KCV72177.1 hypothetical protein H696_01579 [Fonticula alba]|eukprot:XP_009493755.1 hypothetical protein H696_01579 [Fonticula alba]
MTGTSRPASPIPDEQQGNASDASQEEQDDNQPIYLYQNPGEVEEASVIESLCMSCHEKGETRLLMIRIPHFREVVLMSFTCPHCHFRNSQLMSTREMGERGVRISCKIDEPRDLTRQVVYSEFATISIPELDLEIPPNSENGALDTAEGVLMQVLDKLELYQPDRLEADPEAHAQIAAFIARGRKILALEEYTNAEGEAVTGYTITIDDPSGNSYIENFFFPATDPKIAQRTYIRTSEQNKTLGINDAPDVYLNEAPEELMTFSSNCNSCGALARTVMQMVNVPHFKEVIIMATNCDACGFKSNEVKSGGAISETGRRITLEVTDAEDLSRDVLKSASASIRIPEIGLDAGAGTLGGRFTTLEGILLQIHDELKSNPFLAGDSFQSASGRSGGAAGGDSLAPLPDEVEKFLASIRSMIAGEIIPFTFILDDPLGASHLQNIYAPDADPHMHFETYERTWEQNEEWGLNDMNTEEGTVDATEGQEEKPEEESTESSANEAAAPANDE